MRNNQQNNQRPQIVYKQQPKYWLIFSIVLLVDIVGIVSPIVSLLKLKAFNNENDHIMNQVNRKQIKDIIIVKEQANKHDECPQGYSDLFQYQFQGLDPFYLCRENVLPYKEGETYVDDKEQCQFYEEMKPKQLSVLKLGNDNIRICGKYMNYNIKLKKQCNENEIVCSFISDFKSYTCAQTENDCPINNILIEEIQNTNGGYEQSLKFQNQAPNQMPVIGFEIVEGETKCTKKDASMFKDRKYHKIFRRKQYPEQCDRDYLYKSIFEIKEEDFYEINEMSFLNQIHDFNIQNQYKYSPMVIHQIPWNPKHASEFNSYVNWNLEGITDLKNIQFYNIALNILAAISIALLSLKPSDRNENAKIIIKLIQICLLWFYFFNSILQSRFLFQNILSNYQISTSQIVNDVLNTKKFFYESVDILYTIMVSFLSTTIMLLIMQKWYFRKQETANPQVSLQQLQTFQPFFDDDQI